MIARHRLLLALIVFVALPGCSRDASLAEDLLTAPTRVMGRPLALVAGDRADADRVRAHLEGAGYRETEPGTVETGRFHLGPHSWQIGQRAFRWPDGATPESLLAVAIDDEGRIRSLRADADDALELVLDDGLEVVLLEPELLGEIGRDDTDRQHVPLAQLPPVLIDAVLAAEDQRFFWHPGIDPIRMAGAALENWRAGRVVEGGSTLTQQLVKNVHLTPERTFRRKLREIGLALRLELRHSKEDILEAYLTQIYLGQDRGRAIHGVASASRVYFDRDVTELGVTEAALLAGIIRGPNALSPFRHPERATARRNRVIEALYENGSIDAATRSAALAAPLGVKHGRRASPRATHFVEAVARRLGDAVGTAAARDGGHVVFTTLDGALQRSAEAAVARELARIERAYPRTRRERDPLQASLVAIDPVTGDVLAWVGGRDAHSSFDRVASARRQPGSVFKPLVALAAFSAERESPLTLATVLEDRPLELEVEGRTWAPRNYERTFRGAVTLRDALADSLNVPFARLGMEAGLVHVAETARRFGITTPLRPVPSLSLGAFEVTPLEMTAAYGALAAGGQRAEPRAILAVVSPGGEVLGGERVLRERVARAEHAWLVTSALRSAVDRGTGRTLRSLGVDGPVAGKTGTTNGARDAWFVGMTPDLVIGVWVGFDDGARVGLTGAQAALPIFARFLRTARGQGGWQDFEAPGGIVTAAIDPTSGLGAGPGCGGREEHFVRGTVPREHCGGASSLGHRLRGLLPW
jgi:penicillin-binding protein 1B